MSETVQLDSVTARSTSQKSTNGAAHTNQQGGIWDYGTWPSNVYLPATAILTASASGTTVFQTNDVTGYNGLIIEVAAIGGTTPKLTLSISMDGVTFAASLPELINLVDNSVILGSAGMAAIGLFALNTPASTKVKYKAIKVVQTGGAADQTCTLRYAHFWA